MMNDFKRDNRYIINWDVDFRMRVLINSGFESNELERKWPHLPNGQKSRRSLRKEKGQEGRNQKELHI